MKILKSDEGLKALREAARQYEEALAVENQLYEKKRQLEAVVLKASDDWQAAARATREASISRDAAKNALVAYVLAEAK